MNARILHPRKLALLAVMLGLTLTPESIGESHRAVLREAQARVVKILGAGGLGGLEGYQTGLIISADGHVVTMNSTVLDEGEVTTVTIDGDRRTGRVLGADPIADLAVLQVDFSGEPTPFFELDASMADPTAATGDLSGEPVWVLANLFGIATGDEPVSVLHGVVAGVAPLRARRGQSSAYDRGEALLLDAVTSNPGAAGGAVIDRRGRLLGVLGRELRAEATGAWVSHATPTAAVRRVVERVLSANPAAEVAEDSGAAPEGTDLLATWGFALLPALSPRMPPYVEYVALDSPADLAGLRADDLVVLWDGRAVATCREANRLAARSGRSQSLSLTIQRGDDLIDLTFDRIPPTSIRDGIPAGSVRP
ncbi:MAG: trypsin-like peptidase domain-containing protein [Planctomycetota bacterium]